MVASATDTGAPAWAQRFSRPEKDVLLLSLDASWRLENGLPTIAEFERQLDDTALVRRVGFDTGQLTGWDSGLLVYLGNIFALCAQRNIQIDKTGLPEGVRRLLDLALAVPPKQGTGRDGSRVWRFDLVQLTRDQDYWVRVGNVDNPVGRTGLAHMFEQLDSILRLTDHPTTIALQRLE